MASNLSNSKAEGHATPAGLKCGRRPIATERAKKSGASCYGVSGLWSPRRGSEKAKTNETRSRADGTGLIGVSRIGKLRDHWELITRQRPSPCEQEQVRHPVPLASPTPGQNA